MPSSVRRAAVALPALAVLCVLALLPGGGAAWLRPPAALAADATITFAGSLNPAGLLTALLVRPSSVTIPAGGQVAFTNTTGASLTLSVAGESLQLSAGGQQSVSFTGAAKEQTYAATASALNLPVVGSLISPTARIVVTPAALFGAADPDPDGDTVVVTPPAATASPGPTPTGTAAVPTAVPTGGPSDGPNPSDDGQDPSGAPRSPDTDSSDGSSAAAAGNDSDGDGGWSHGESGDLVVPPVPGLRTQRDQFGLLIALAAVLFLGVGAAAVRTVLAYRTVLVGAHSAKARRARRRR
jgi:hypothetical protein